MLNRTAARRRPLSHLHYLLSLLALVGATTALLVVTRVEAHPSADPGPPAPATEHPTRDLSGAGDPPHHDDPTDGNRVHRPAPDAATDRANRPVPDAEAGRADRSTAVLTETGHRTRLQGAGPGRPTPTPPVDLHRSLIWSGLLGLAISLTGLGIVGVRRRMW